MKLSENFMVHLASMPITYNNDSSLSVGQNYVLEKTESNKWYLVDTSNHQFAMISSTLFGVFVQTLTS